MTLVPMKGLVGGVSKLEISDPRASRMLVQLGLFEALTDQIEQVREPMTQQVMKNLGQVNATTRARLERSQIAKNEEGEPYMAGLDVLDEVVEKGIVGDLVGHALNLFNRNHPRDDRGRFIRRNLATGTDPNLPYPQRLSSHMTEAVNWRDKMIQSGLIDDKTMLHLGLNMVDDKGKPSGTRRHMKVQASDLLPVMGQIPDHLPVELAVSRRDLKRMSPQQMAAVDLTALSMQESFPNAAAMTRDLFDNNGKPKLDGEKQAQNWYGRTEGTNRQAYNRIKMTGQVLSRYGAPGGTASAAGGLAQLVGEIGPEAEKILAPGIRRTAYRYRGTERRPDRDLYTSIERATAYTDGLADPRTRAQASSQIIEAANTGKDTAATIANVYRNTGISEDQLDLAVRGGTAVASMLGIDKGGREHGRLPDLELTELSLEAGEMPPSEGVIIDARGRLITQAVGYNGDHYLPFDLRNLGSLFGGQYVRTRATGGPTTEDIYTALVTGTRQIQVVSNSGVFTVEFDPDLRGVRRFNDKVKRMVERYGSLLETIHNNKSTFFETDVDAETKADIRQRAAAAAGGDETKYKTNYDKLLAQARFEQSSSRSDFEELEQRAYDRAKTVVDAQIKQSRSQFTPQSRARLIEDTAREWLKEQNPGVRELTLNGEGYNRALKALKQEFPYYIRQTSFQPLPEWLSSRNLQTMGYRRNAPKEKGYVEQGQTNTARTRVGGFRSARLVQTGRPEARRSAATGTDTGTPRPVATGARTPAPTTGAQPAQANKPNIGAILQRQLGTAFHPLARMVHELPPPIDYPASTQKESEVMAQFPSETYLFWKVGKVIERSEPDQWGEALAKWFTTDATPSQRNAIFEGLDELAEDPNAAENNVQPQRVRNQTKQVRDTLGLIEPFAKPAEGQQPWEVDPAAAGKPVDYGDAPAWDEPVEKWEQAVLQLGIDRGQDFVDEIDTLQGKTKMARQAYVKDLHKAYIDAQEQGKDLTDPQKDLETAQRAWAFVHARDVARRLRELTGGEAEAPKAPELEVVKGLRYDPPAQDFLLDLRNQIDGLLRNE